MKYPKARNRFGNPVGWRSMWIFAMFDLPTGTEKQRKAYMRYRKILFNDGFSMIQYSVYYRHCASQDLAQTHIKKVSAEVPPEGEVRFLMITDKQFGNMQIFQGKSREETPAAPAQLEFF